MDEDHPIRPQDPYAIAKHFGEQLMDAAVRRSDLRCVSIRPSWVQHEGTYERNLGPVVRDAAAAGVSLGSYIDVHNLADAIVLSVESALEGHEVFYIASPDNAGGRDLRELAKQTFGDAVEVRPYARVDASAISCDKAARLLGWTPRRSWRDYLDADGVTMPICSDVGLMS
ncbi:NAD-dependent epimerase/dehydratase family protein [Nonomuraea africana]|uniref:NAD-dependent epimerase/dehydratase family protein n=1 Tax=Nonomuraea africana TaxID=46171 RepID=UPI0033E2F964